MTHDCMECLEFADDERDPIRECCGIHGRGDDEKLLLVPVRIMAARGFVSTTTRFSP